MYSTYSEGKSVVDESFIQTLKDKVFKHMINISKKNYFDVLDYIVNKYKSQNNKPIDVTLDSYADKMKILMKNILNQQ